MALVIGESLVDLWVDPHKPLNGINLASQAWQNELVTPLGGGPVNGLIEVTVSHYDRPAWVDPRLLITLKGEAPAWKPKKEEWLIQSQTPLLVATSYLGVKYLWGGRSRAGIDCSGLVQAGFLCCGEQVLIPRDADQQEDYAANRGMIVSWEEAQPGDLLTFNGIDNINEAAHIGFYAGEGKILHATWRSEADQGVKLEPIPPALLDRLRYVLRIPHE